MLMLYRTLWTTIAATAAAAWLVTMSPTAQQQQQQQPTDIAPTISSDQAGTQPRLAIPDFLALPAAGSATADAETVEVAKSIAQVLTADFEFEREFALLPKDILNTIPPAKSVSDVPFDRWREVAAAAPS
jgi:hypothetical protein